MKLFTAPETVLFLDNDGPILFLGGAIDKGKASDWQQELIKKLSKQTCIILNPRRKEWDPTWEQSIRNPQFVEQVNWELDGIELFADIVLIYLPAGTAAPITLLEYGLSAKAKSATVVVYCPEGFYRKGNVDIVAQRNDIPVFEDQDLLVKHLIDLIKQFHE